MLLFQGAIPLALRPYGVQAFSIEDARRSGIVPRFNTCVPVPFGCLGKAVLPKGVLAKDKFDSRVTHVAALGVDPLTSGGVRVLYPASGGVLRTATVLQRDVAFLPEEFAFERSVRDLREVDTVLPELVEGCVNPIKKWMVQCNLCGKWRFASKLVHGRHGIEGVVFRCTNVGVSGTTKDDIRVWEECE